MNEPKKQENSGPNNGPRPDGVKPGWLEIVRDQVASLRFGTVLITVHDARVVQVERVEKVRLDNLRP